MRTVETSVAQSLMFIRFAKLTPRFENDAPVVSTKEIAESYQERLTRDGVLEPALATLVANLRMCIWEANYIDWLATVIHRVKYSKFFSEPSKATKLQARYLAQIVPTPLDAKEVIADSKGQEQNSLAVLFPRACAELNRSEVAVSDSIQQCINRKALKDTNEVLTLEEAQKWCVLYQRIVVDIRHLKECIPTQFIPFQAYVRGALSEFARVHFQERALGWMKPCAGSVLFQKQSNENRPAMEPWRKVWERLKLEPSYRGDVGENKQRVTVKSGGLKGGGNVDWGLGEWN